jgi:uncharacterized membrane protein YkoI
VSKPGEVMNKGARHGRRALLCCLLSVAFAAVPAQAEREDARREASREQQRDAGAARAAAIAQARHGGKVLKVSPQGGSFYKVRLLLPDGTVKSVTVDAGG